MEADLGLATLLGDGEVSIVGGEKTEVGATTSGPGVIPVVSEWAPAREPVVEPSRPQPTTPSVPTVAEASDLRFPTK